MTDQLNALARQQLAEIERLQRENIPSQTWAMLTSVERYVDLFVEHRARAHEAMRLMMSMPKHGLLADDTPEGVKQEARDAVNAVRSGLVETLLASLAALLAAMAAAYGSGVVGFDLPIHMGKCFQTSGAAFALWGTLLAVRGPKGGMSNTIPARAHQLIYTVLLGFGGALAMIGTLVSP